MGARQGPFLGGVRPWEVVQTMRNTIPMWAPDMPKSHLPDPTPQRERQGERKGGGDAVPPPREAPHGEAPKKTFSWLT